MNACVCLIAKHLPPYGIAIKGKVEEKSIWSTAGLFPIFFTPPSVYVLSLLTGHGEYFPAPVMLGFAT